MMGPIIGFGAFKKTNKTTKKLIDYLNRKKEDSIWVMFQVIFEYPHMLWLELVAKALRGLDLSREY